MNRASHYETLGVARDADDDAIKLAYRAKISAAHSDRDGGDTEAAKNVNTAYDCLSDPVKRAAYDAGVQHTEAEAAEAAENVLRHLFAQAIDAGALHLPAAVMIQLNNGLQIIDEGLAENKRARKRLLRWRGRVRRTDDGDNVVEAIIADKIVAIDKAVYEQIFARDLNRRVAEMVAAYDDAGELMDHGVMSETMLIGGAP